MGSGENCKECGSAIPANRPNGFCAQCLLRLGLRLEDGEQAAKSTEREQVGPDTPTQTVNPGSSSFAPPMLKAGDCIGRYKLLQQIGEGGCGVVYMAEQEEPVHRRVALKVIKLGMDTAQVVARFEAERQALALMEHPNIAKVLDAGSTETGRPYFVMELVRGIRITDYCDQNKLSTSERVELFIQVCQAIQHAHQKGVIHRDIKPSNVLVTLHDGVPVPKVIDFGIAKATQGRLTDQTLFTAFEQFIGTPAYMSPEQAEMSGLDIDTRSDIYSLGVLLYELLVGRTPFEARELVAVGIDQMRRTIREQEPVRPSTRLSTMLAGELTTTAERRQTNAPKLIHLVRGDLDWIVMKCLEKDRTRRYETANGLARDIERHLNNEPLVARRPNTAYRVQKFVRRNKVMVTAVATIAVVLVLGTVASAWQALRATHAKGVAVQAQQNETKERQRAQNYAQNLRRTLYASEMNVAYQTWQTGDAERTRSLLAAQCPPVGEDDLRGWEWRYLWSGARRQELDEWNCGNSVVSLAYSPDGKNFVTLGPGPIQWWDAASRRPVAQLGDFGYGYTVAFSPDGNLLLTTHAVQNQIRVWDAHTQQFLGVFTNHAMQVAGAAFIPNGKAIISAGGMVYMPDARGELKLWDASTFQEIANFEQVDFSLIRCDVSPDGRLVAGSGIGPVVQIWDFDSRKPIARLTGHETKSRGGVFALRFSPDGQLLATGDFGGTVRLWNVQTREATVIGSHGYPLDSLAFSPDGKRLATAGRDHTLRLWDVASRSELAILRHSARVWSVAFAPDGKTLATGGHDGTVKFWSANPLSEANVFARNIGHGRAGYSADGRFLAWEDSGRTNLTIWALARTNAAQTLSGWDFAFAPAGDQIAVIWPTGQLPTSLKSASELQTGRLQIWTLDPLAEISLPREITVHLSEQPALAYSPSGDRLAVINPHVDLVVWALKAWKEQARINARAVNATLLFAPDGESLLAAGPNDEITQWRIATGERMATFRGHSSFVTSASISPDGRLLATGSHDTTVRLWDFATRRELAKFVGGAGEIYSLTFSRDGKTIAAGSYEGAIQLWNVATGQQVGMLQGHISFIRSLAFAPDGNTLASSSMDNTLRLWKAASWQEVARAAPTAQ
jgi:WD40 repeat protein/serine/threonine protein kinase